MARPQPRYKKGDKIGGRYEVYDVKMGGMGEVYLCLDLETDIPFALKTFQKRYLANPKLRQAFENEVATWVALEKHPNIVRCYMVNILDNQPFMILEWIAGGENESADLRSWLRRGPLNLRTALDLTIDICRGLIYAQGKQSGFVHRDLKPENILIAHGQLAKITDFGLAQIVQKANLEISKDMENVTNVRQNLLGQGGGIVGTPPYMAPEQWRNEPLDVRTDIYAVGCILFEMLTGSWPFQATNLDGFRHQHLEGDIPSLMYHQKKFTTLNALMARCLAKQPKERFISVNDLLQELEVFYLEQFTVSPRTTVTDSEFTAVDYVIRGLTYQRLNLYNEAIADYSTAIKIDTAHPMLSEPEEIYSNRGLMYDAIREYDKALSDFNRAIQINPSLVQAFLNRGRIYATKHLYDEALADYAYAINLKPNYSLIYVNRANLYNVLHRYDEALADYNLAIKLEPNSAVTYLARGEFHLKLQRYEMASTDFSWTLQLDPINAEAYYYRGDAYHQLQRYEEALGDFNKAIECNPTFAKAYNDRAVIYAKLRNYEKALPDHDRTIQLNFNLSGSYFNRGITYNSMGLYGQALADYNSAIQLDSSKAQFYFNRGSTYFKLQMYDKALTDFDQTIRLEPTNIEAYLFAGALLADLGIVLQALIYYQKAEQLGDERGVQGLALVKKKIKELAFQQKINVVSGKRAIEQVIDINIMALAACITAASFNGMRQVAENFSFITGSDFIANFEQNVITQVLPFGQSILQQRLSWMRQIAREKEMAVETQLAVKSFLNADSIDKMREAVVEFPFMTDLNDFIVGLEEDFKPQIPTEYLPTFEQRLIWLKQIANEQK